MRQFLPLLPLILLPALAPTLAHAQTKPDRPTQLESKTASAALVQRLLREGKIMRASDAKRGQKGVAYSVFQGTKIEKFDVVVLGTLEKSQGGGDLVLIKVTSGPVVKRQSGIIQGMSGSPVYIGGKLLGAIAIGFGFPKEPIGGVTPITQMISGALPDNSQKMKPVIVASTAVEVFVPKSPLVIQNRRIARLEVTRDLKQSAFSGSMKNATMRMRPATQFLLLSGVSEGGLNRWKSMLAPYGITPVLGGGAMIHSQVFGTPSKKSGIKANLAPGAAIGVQLASGDIDATGVGTVTYRIGNRVLAFGHPMFNLGAVSMPMTTAYVHDIFPAYDISFKLASPIASVGELQQDTNFAIGGTVGRAAQTVPLRISLLDAGKKINKKYNVRLIKDPTFTPQIAQSIAVDALQATLGLDSDKMVKIAFSMGLKNGPAIHRVNTVYAADQVVAGALGEMLDALSITQANGFEKGNITSMDLNVEVIGARKTARIRRIYADKNRLKAGESAQISVVLEPTGEPDEQITRRFTVRVPADAPSGSLRVAASSAADIFTARGRVGGAPPRPGNFKELLGAYAQIGANNELLLQTSTPRRFLLIDRKRVSNPPPSWNRLVPSGPSSSVSDFNETQSQKMKSEWVLSGVESLSIPVESSRESDKTKPDAPDSDDGIASATISNSSDAVAADLSGVDDADSFVARLPKMDELDAAPNFSARWKQLSRVLMQIPLPKPTPPVPTEPQIPPQATPTPSPKVAPITGVTPAPGATPTPTPVPTPVPTAEATARNIARPAGRFIQRTSADFSRGKFDGALVESDGIIRVGPRNQRLFSSAEPLAWSVAADGKGVVYLGTGNSARLLKIENGASKVLYEGPEIAVTALALDANGILYAGVSPGGRVLRFNADGTHQVVLNTGQTFIHALKFDGNGNLIVATGGESAKIYRLSAEYLRFQSAFVGQVTNQPIPAAFASIEKPLATLPQKHARSLAFSGDSMFVGTSDDAVLYRIDRDGKTTALYQAGGASNAASDDGPTIIVAPSATSAAPTSVAVFSAAGISSGASQSGGNEILAVATSGESVYFGTANSGSIFRWNAQSGVQELFKTPGRAIYALQMQGDALFAATGESGEVWRVSDLGGDVQGARVLDATQPQVMALASANNRIFAATGNNAAAYEIGGAGANSFTSNVFDAGQIVRFGSLNSLSSGATFEFRSGNTLEPDATWSSWNAVQNGQSVGENRARYAQYRARLNDGGTISRVEFSFRAPNRAPGVRFTSPAGGEAFSGKKTLTWSGTDPDKDPLRYSLQLVGADGKTQEIELTTATAASQEIDTKKYADGIYTAKITASDAARNPENPQIDSAISLPFTLDNTAPTMDKPVATKNGESWDITFSGTDLLSPLAGAEWRVASNPGKSTKNEDKSIEVVKSTKNQASATNPANSTKNQLKTPTAVLSPVPAAVSVETAKAAEVKPGDWQAAASADGFFDGKSEKIVARLDPKVAGIALKSGDRIEFRVRDAADNAVTSIVVLP
ncbi:SpoIVB peptidase S55 [Abditibacterium utsteinense]|uniref:SpoIVB peptidase S55 n=1 Tax=Abditibacterium utsteinense TaxID=1960156 RepID=A0A2S8SQE4_9BACT|nr:SpoIVB peptidase S55 domain-containing protein [Abditibacterium utsteinense]PQV62969.1 SpoIVB peptidase S55 [Abditibacterium utsteinense]